VLDTNVLISRLLMADSVPGRAERVPILQQIQACRDPRDDKFLEVAINGEADMIITGDGDLLALHPFMGMPILTPLDYLVQVEQSQ
jgi:predicted nucleic acid-binding protein